MPCRSSIISRIAWPGFHAVFWFTPRKRAITTEEMPLEEVSTRNIAAIQIRRSSFVAWSGVLVVTVNWLRHSLSTH